MNGLADRLSHTDYEDEKALFLRIAAGDEAAYTRIFHLYTPRLLPYMTKITRDEPLARELLQETFLRLWMKREDLLRVELPDSWLFRIAANICLNHLRQYANRARIVSAMGDARRGDGMASPAETLEGRELGLMIRQAVEALPEGRREVYRLSREEGLSHAEIAARLGISVHTVKNQLGAALQFIHRRLHEATGLSLTLIAALFLL